MYIFVREGETVTEKDNIFKELLMRYEAAERAIIWERGEDIKLRERLLDDELRNYRVRWIWAGEVEE